MEDAFGGDDLTEDFGGGKIAGKSEFAGGAEGAVGGASGLRGDAEAGPAAGDAKDHGFKGVAIVGEEGEFGGSVLGRVLAEGKAEVAEINRGGESIPDGFRNFLHAGSKGRAFFKERDAEAFEAVFGQGMGAGPGVEFFELEDGNHGAKNGRGSG